MSVIASKTWSVSATSSGKQPLQIFCGGRPLTQTAPATIDGVSPVEYLLISVATCFALSCRAVLVTRRLTAADFEVAVVGTKALDLPSRLSHIEVTVAFGGNIPEDAATGIAAEAKLLCTVYEYDSGVAGYND